MVAGDGVSEINVIGTGYEAGYRVTYRKCLVLPAACQTFPITPDLLKIPAGF